MNVRLIQVNPKLRLKRKRRKDKKQNKTETNRKKPIKTNRQTNKET